MGDIRGLTGQWLGLRRLASVRGVREIVELFSPIVRLFEEESHLARIVEFSSSIVRLFEDGSHLARRVSLDSSITRTVELKSLIAC